MQTKPDVKTFEVNTCDLEKARKEMSGSWFGLRSRVLSFITEGEKSLITIETIGSCRFVEARWDKFIVTESVQTEKPIESEQETEQKRGRGRGRPRKT